MILQIKKGLDSVLPLPLTYIFTKCRTSLDTDLNDDIAAYVTIQKNTLFHQFLFAESYNGNPKERINVWNQNTKLKIERKCLLWNGFCFWMPSWLCFSLHSSHVGPKEFPSNLEVVCMTARRHKNIGTKGKSMLSRENSRLIF